MLETFESPTTGRAWVSRDAAAPKKEPASSSRRANLPVALFLLQCGHTKKLIDGIFRIVGFHLLRIVVFVLNVDIAILLLVLVLVFEIIAVKVKG